jgi:hypothetical protein
MVYTIVVHLYAKAEPECIEKLKAKLVEASLVYSKDRETLGWFVSEFCPFLGFGGCVDWRGWWIG